MGGREGGWVRGKVGGRQREGGELPGPGGAHCDSISLRIKFIKTFLLRRECWQFAVRDRAARQASPPPARGCAPASPRLRNARIIGEGERGENEEGERPGGERGREREREKKGEGERERERRLRGPPRALRGPRGPGGGALRGPRGPGRRPRSSALGGGGSGLR